MKLIFIRWAALLIGSAINIYSLFNAGFGVLVVISRLTDENTKLQLFELNVTLLLLLNIVAIVVAWFRIRLGGFLITLSAILNILYFTDGRMDDSNRQIMKIPLLVVGLLLLLYDYYNQSLSKKAKPLIQLQSVNRSAELRWGMLMPYFENVVEQTSHYLASFFCVPAIY